MRTWRDVLVLCAGLAVACAPGRAWAQPAPTPEEVQQAKNRWTEGKAFFDAGNFEAARVAFRQALSLFPHPAFLQNLGEAELRTGRNVEASRHLEAFLRSTATGSIAQREGARKSLQRASENLGSLLIETNVVDAEVRVDDEVVGRSPLGPVNWYVEPGPHSVSARREGYLSGSESVTVTAGPPKSVFVRVQRVVGALPDDSLAAGSTSAPSNAVAAAPGGRSAETPSSTYDRSSLQPRTVVLVGGAVLTMGALAVGTVYAVSVGSQTSKVKAGAALLPSEGACLMPTSDQVAYCNQLAVWNTRARTFRSISNAAFIAASGLGVATGLVFVLWRPAGTQVALSPWVSPTSSGFEVAGHF